MDYQTSQQAQHVGSSELAAGAAFDGTILGNVGPDFAAGTGGHMEDFTVEPQMQNGTLVPKAEAFVSVHRWPAAQHNVAAENGFLSHVRSHPRSVCLNCGHANLRTRTHPAPRNLMKLKSDGPSHSQPKKLQVLSAGATEQWNARCKMEPRFQRQSLTSNSCDCLTERYGKTSCSLISCVLIVFLVSRDPIGLSQLCKVVSTGPTPCRDSGGRQDRLAQGAGV